VAGKLQGARSYPTCGEASYKMEFITGGLQLHAFDRASTH
jgi:hypothetical protein